MTEGELCHWQSSAPLDDQGKNHHIHRPRKDCKARSIATSRPLFGKSFFLDLPSGKNLTFLAENVKRLGGVIESFLSKEVTCVVSSSQEARRERREEKPTATALRAAQAGAPSFSRLLEDQRGPLHKPALASRGKALLHKAIGSQDNIGSSSILVSARFWGIQIMHMDGRNQKCQPCCSPHCDFFPLWQKCKQLLCGEDGKALPWSIWEDDEMLSYIRKLSKKQLPKTKVTLLASGCQPPKVRLKPPFVKVEDRSRKLRPFLKLFKNFPQLYFLASGRCSPFEPPQKLSSSKELKTRRLPNGSSLLSACSFVPQTQKGYCECCEENFTELQVHLQSSQHQAFVLDPSHYTFLDCLISQLSNDFDFSCTTSLSRDSSAVETEAAEHARGPFPGQVVEDHMPLWGLAGLFPSLENSTDLLMDQSFLQPTAKPVEMPTASVPLALQSLWSRSETDEEARVAANTFPKAETKLCVASQEGKLPMQSAVLPCKRRHSCERYGPAKKRRRLISNKRPPSENFLPTSQQGDSFPSQLDLPAAPSYTPSSYCVPQQLPQKALHCHSGKPVAIDTSCLRSPAQQLDQKVSAAFPCKEWDIGSSCNFSNADPTLSSKPKGFHKDIHAAPSLVGSVLELCLPYIDVSELAQKMLPQQPGQGPRPCLPLPSYPLTEAKSSSSMSEWDGPLLCVLAGASRLPSESQIDAALLGTCVSLQDSGYESHLSFVLQQTSEQGQLK